MSQLKNFSLYVHSLSLRVKSMTYILFRKLEICLWETATLNRHCAQSWRKTVCSFFGKSGSAANEAECIQIVTDVVSCLYELGKFLFISPGEIYVKPATQHHGGQILRHAQNLKMPKKTVPALIINFLQEKPAFVACFSPIQNLEHEYLFEWMSYSSNWDHSQFWGPWIWCCERWPISISKGFKHFTRNTPQIQFAWLNIRSFLFTFYNLRFKTSYEKYPKLLNLSIHSQTKILQLRIAKI